MTDKRSSLGNKISRKCSRFSEKFRQKFGKSEKTIDEAFNECSEKFSDIYEDVMVYAKAAKGYYRSLKRLRDYNREFMESLLQLYDDSWVESGQVRTKTRLIYKNYDTLISNFKESVIVPLREYVQRMESIRVDINRRNKRRLEYDASRRNLENLQAAKTLNNEKISNAVADVEETRKEYNAINENVIEGISYFIEARAYYLSMIMDSFAEELRRFHREACEYFADITERIWILHRNSIDDKVEEYIAKERSATPLDTSETSDSSKSLTPEMTRSNEQAESDTGTENLTEDSAPIRSDPITNEDPSTTQEDKDTAGNVQKDNVLTESENPILAESDVDDVKVGHEDESKSNDKHQVKCVKEYDAKIPEELSIKVGEIINILDSPSVSDGYQYGVKDGDGSKGVFPQKCVEKMN